MIATSSTVTQWIRGGVGHISLPDPGTQKTDHHGLVAKHDELFWISLSFLKFNKIFGNYGLSNRLPE